eukprot:366775-Pelagomonas_calceolata.AAC.6
MELGEWGCLVWQVHAMKAMCTAFLAGSGMVGQGHVMNAMCTAFLAGSGMIGQGHALAYRPG